MFAKTPRPQKKYSSPARRKRFARRVAGFFVRVVLAAALLCVLGLIVVLGWRLYGFLYRSDYFLLRETQVAFAEGSETGAEASIERQIRNKLRRDGLGEGNLIRLDPEAARRAVESVPRVRKAVVAKRYPSRLEIVVEQRRIAVLLLHDPILAIDAEGVVIEKLTLRHRPVLEFPFVSGLELGRMRLGDRVASEGLTRALQLLSSLEKGKPTLAAEVSEVHCDTENRLTLILKGGTEVRFGADDPIWKMPILETFIRERGAAQKFAYIDLRLDGQVPAMLKEEAARRRLAASALAPMEGE